MSGKKFHGKKIKTNVMVEPKEVIVSDAIADAILSTSLSSDFIQTVQTTNAVSNAFKETVLITPPKSKKPHS